MPSFITKFGRLFKKSSTYKPSMPEVKEQRKQSPKATKKSSQKVKKKNPQKIKKKWNIESFKVEPEKGKVRFHDIDLPPEIMHALCDLDFKYCTPIQAEILPATLAGKDMAGKAQTGTGKTAAFLLGIFTKFYRIGRGRPIIGRPRALVLAPTRELAMQIRDDAEKIGKYTPCHTVAVYGGIDYQKQRKLFEKPVDIVVATPGRLIDFLQQKVIDLRDVQTLVIDEADRMLDMGFIPDVRRIVYKTPPKERRQTLLFSATLDDEVMRLASSWMTDPGKIEIEPDHTATELVDQRVYLATDKEKFPLLYNILKNEVKDSSALIFTNRRDQANKLYEMLYRYGINCEMLSGAVAQNKRQRILANFKSGKTKLVVATDVAGRGIHVDDITHVINFNIPSKPDDYVHRIGRTGRAGKKGISVTFACEMESFEIPAIEELLGERLSCIQPEEEMLKLPPKPVHKYKAKPHNSSPKHKSNHKGGSHHKNSQRKKSGNKKPAGHKSTDHKSNTDKN